MKGNSPLLTIGIIFKNEIRCLERCLKSLEPLREALPCELVMADTGSDDGSREIAAKYADILFDFPWIDDFSAARNAVMDRSSGKWYLSIDADEWLGPYLDELIKFLTRQHNFNFFGVKIRNYKSEDLEAGGLYSDSTANRIVRMSTGMRFQNTIHEAWNAIGQPIIVLSSTIFYHDGYLFARSGSRQEKEDRNLRMLRRALEKQPDHLGLLLQSYESSYVYPEEHLEYIRRAIQGVEEKRYEWERCGPAIYRHGIATAFADELPELEGWIARAEELFPDSIVTRVDVNHTVLGLCWNREDYAGCVRRGEAYFHAIEDYESGNFNIRDVTASPLLFASDNWQQTARVFLAAAYLYENQPEKCAWELKELFHHPLDEKQTEEAVRALVRLHMQTELDTAPLILALWERVNEPVPTQKAAEKRLDTFYHMGYGALKEDFQLEEGGTVLRSVCGLFVPLEERCTLGRAAAVLETDDPEGLEKKLSAVEDWNEFPVAALVHALESGAAFPPPDRPLKLEETDALAARLAERSETLCRLVETARAETLPELCWVRALALAAVQSYDWTGDAQDGVVLARTFARVERDFLSGCYVPEVLQTEAICILPPMHRFGWRCAQAFAALDAGSAAEYVRFLRKGLEMDPAMKPMVEYLTDHTPGLRSQQPSGELLALAEQVRTLLARYSPDDPAVVALKQSAAYQKVARLIDGPDPGVFGGLKQ